MNTEKKLRVLTGVTTSGTPHLGNYVGSIRPAIASTLGGDVDAYFFLADYHGLIKYKGAERLYQSTIEIAATWLACGLDPERVNLYRQSDIPEIPELTWMLNCFCPKGLMNRAHAYKAAVQENENTAEDPDHGINMGLYSYPVLMSADILMFNAMKVPVGKDQIQHVEMTRDIAQRFNHQFGEIFTLPEAAVEESVELLKGLDGRKMSKSYDNHIPLFEPEKKFRKLIMKIETNSLPPEAPKDPDDSTLFDIYRAFADDVQIAQMRERYLAGIAWGEMKQELFELINAELIEKREKYNELIAKPSVIEDVLQAGAAKVRVESAELMRQIRDAVGIRALR